MTSINSTEFTDNLTLLPPLNETTPSLPSISVLLAKLDFHTSRTLIITFILPAINLIGAVFGSLSLWIFFGPSFSDPIYFYYKLLCFINILNSLHNVPYSVSIWPLYFPWINSYALNVFKIYHLFLSVLFFHFEDVLTMAILLHKMKLFSPFVKKHFSKSPQLISFSLFLTCLFIDVPFIFGLEVGSRGDYFYVD